MTSDTESFSLADLAHIRQALLKAPLPFEQTYPVLMRIESIIAGLNKQPTDGDPAL
jgi:hypothetical protein